MWNYLSGVKPPSESEKEKKEVWKDQSVLQWIPEFSFFIFNLLSTSVLSLSKIKVSDVELFIGGQDSQWIWKGNKGSLKKYLPEWENGRPWLKYVDKGMVCIEFVSNGMFVTGCIRYKDDSLTKHEKSKQQERCALVTKAKLKSCEESFSWGWGITPPAGLVIFTWATDF